MAEMWRKRHGLLVVGGIWPTEEAPRVKTGPRPISCDSREKANIDPDHLRETTCTDNLQLSTKPFEELFVVHFCHPIYRQATTAYSFGTMADKGSNHATAETGFIFAMGQAGNPFADDVYFQRVLSSRS